jgi:uncharacterized protein (TIGR03118 family)
MQNEMKHDDVAGAGNGFVDVFDTNGKLIRRVASHGNLNSPWGIAQSPFNFGALSNALLIGNFGDGRINAFGGEGRSRGLLLDTSNKPIVLDGLWSVSFGGAADSDPGTLYFTSGPAGETGGLVGTLTPK